MQKHIGKAAAKLVNAPLAAPKSPRVTQSFNAPPDKFTYALASYTAERRKDGWYVAKTIPSFNGEKPKWSGPFETIENGCLSIGRHLATEIADRHTRSIEAHKIARDSSLYGLKPTTRLRAR